MDSSYNCALCNSTIGQCEVCTYSGSLTCSTCSSGYYTDSTTSCATCSSGQTNCNNCDSTGAGTLWCWDCVNTHYISDTTAGTCSLCSAGVTNCVTCQEKATASLTCLHCTSLYYADTSGAVCNACSGLLTNCYNCTETYNSTGSVDGATCLNCNTPYYATSAGACVTCDNATYNCATCEESGSGSFACSVCNTAYFLNATDTRCYGCPSICSTCTSLTVCTACVNTTYFVNSSSYCALCSSNVSSWVTCQFDGSSNLVPLSCADNFWLDSSGALPVCTNCTVSNSTFANCTDATTALSCQAGYYLSGSSCLTCQGINANWASCSDATHATSCVSGYYLDNSACVDCTGLSIG